MENSDRPGRISGERWSFPACIVFALAFFFTFTILYAQKARTFNPTMFDTLDIYVTNLCMADRGFAAAIHEMPTRAFFFINEPPVLLAFPLISISAEPYSIAPINPAAIALAIVLLYLLVRRWSNSGALGLTAALMLGLNPHVQSWVLSGFRPPLWGLPFFLLFWLFAERGRRVPAIVFLVLANLSKSNIAMANLVLGFLLLVIKPRHHWAKTILTTSAACVAAVVCGNLAMQHFLGTFASAEMLHLQDYGETAGEAFRSMVARPEILIENLFYAGNLKHIFLLLPFALIPLLGGRYLLALLPELGLMLLTTHALHNQIPYQNLSETFPLLWTTNNNYPNILPHLTMAFAVGLTRLHSWSIAGRPGVHGRLSILVAALALIVSLVWPPQIGGPRPLSLRFNTGYYTVTEHDRTIRRIADLLPKMGSLAVKDNLVCPATTGRTGVTHFEYPNPDVDSDYVLVDFFSYAHLCTRRQFLEKIRSTLQSGRYGVEAFEDGVLLLSRWNEGQGVGDVLDWMSEHDALIAPNLFPPLARGSLSREELRGRVYSQTQIP